MDKGSDLACGITPDFRTMGLARLDQIQGPFSPGSDWNQLFQKRMKDPKGNAPI